MNRLIFQAGAFDQLARLLLHDSRETAAILLASPGRTPAGGWRLVVTEVNPAPPEAYLDRTEASAKLTPVFLAPLIKKARHARASVILTHTHPWHGPVAASPVDILGEAELLPTLFGRIPGLPQARLILGHNGLTAALFDGKTDPVPLLVDDIGSSIKRHPETGPRNRRVQDGTVKLCDCCPRTDVRYHVGGNIDLLSANVLSAATYDSIQAGDVQIVGIDEQVFTYPQMRELLGDQRPGPAQANHAPHETSGESAAPRLEENMGKLEKKVAVITGAASGIGRAPQSGSRARAPRS